MMCLNCKFFKNTSQNSIGPWIGQCSLELPEWLTQQLNADKRIVSSHDGCDLGAGQ